jgi:hypothetical protein
VPAGGSVFTAWGMLPFHDDFLAVAPEAVQWIGLSLAALAIARAIGVREPFASVAAGLVAALPPSRLLVGTGYADPALYLCFGGAAAFTLRWLSSGEAGARVLAAAGLGLTAAISPRLLPLVAVVALLLLFARRGRGALAGSTVFVAAAAPWYLYNLSATGSPLPPEVLRFFDAGPATVFRILQETFSLVGNPVMYLGGAVVPAILALVSVPWLIARRPRLGITLLAVGAVAVCCVFFLREPQTGYPSRLWIPTLLLAVPTSMWWCRSLPRLGRVYCALLVFSLFFELARFLHLNVRPVETAAMLRWATGAFAIGVLVAVLPRWRGLVAVAAAAWLIAYAHGYHVDNRYPAFFDGLVVPATPRGWAKTARLVDGASPRRIAVVGGPIGEGPWITYGLLGSRLQNDVFHVPPPHDRQAWIERLRELDVDFVVAVSPRSSEEPWLKASPGILRPVANGDQPIYQLSR